MSELSKAVMENGCEIKPYSTMAGPIWGHQPAGFKCTGFGIEASGSSEHKAAENWLNLWRQNNPNEDE